MKKRVSNNRLLRRIFGTKGEECRRLENIV
jgi:hypothetical protein